MCFGGSSEPRLLCDPHRRAEGGVGGVRFRRGGEIDHRLRDRELAFGMAEKVVGVLGGVGDDQRLRIGKPDILDRHAHDAAGQEQRILAGIEHAREIIQRGIGIGAAHRFMQRRDQIVMAVGRLVVDRRAALQDLLQLRGVENLVLARGTPDLLGERQRRAAVAIGHAHQHGARFRHRAAASCPRPPRHAQTAFRSRPHRASETPARAPATASAALSSKDGFSVVAPTITTVPSSMTGRKNPAGRG